MSEAQLLPCPFCGGKVILDEDDFYMFCCDTCGAGITFAKELPDGTAEECNKEENILKWNTRKPMDDIVERLGKLAEDTPQYDLPHLKISFHKVIYIVRSGGKE